jgi:hypothetical protein
MLSPEDPESAQATYLAAAEATLEICRDLKRSAEVLIKFAKHFDDAKRDFRALRRPALDAAAQARLEQIGNELREIGDFMAGKGMSGLHYRVRPAAPTGPGPP